MARNKLVVDFIQWILILSLSGMCLVLYLNGQTITKNSNLYKIRNKDLANTNERLSDSINFIRQDNPLIIVKYKLVYKGDTTYVDRKLIPLDNKVYNFTDEKGGIRYQIHVKAKDISWYKINISVNDDSLLLANK